MPDVTNLNVNGVSYEINDEQARNAIEALEEEMDGKIPFTKVTAASTDLDDYTSTGIYYFSSSYTPTNIPAGVNGWLLVMLGSSTNVVKQMWWRQGTNDSNDFNTWIRTKSSSGWSSWHNVPIIDDSASSTYKTYSSSQIDSLLDDKVTQKSIASLSSLELFHSTPYIDFHYGNSQSVDYTSRIIESSSGVLTVMKDFVVNGTLTNDALTVKSISDGTAFSTEEQTVTYDALVGKSYIDVYIQCTSRQLSRIVRVYPGTTNAFVIFNGSTSYVITGYVYFDNSTGTITFGTDVVKGWSIENWTLRTIYYTV